MANPIEITKNWLRTFVIGMNFCPFAKNPFEADTIRYVLIETTDIQVLGDTLVAELKHLANTPPSQVETTLLIHPNLLDIFDEYLNFLEVTEYLLEDYDLDGIIQIASFHPDYQFDGTTLEDVENFTNRSPFPMLHLLRESSVSWAVDSYADVEKVPSNNVHYLKSIGLSEIKKQWDEIKGAH